MKFKLLLPILLVAFTAQLASAVNSVKINPESDFLQINFGVDNVDDFVKLSWKEAANAKQAKLTFKEKVVLKVAQRKMKKKMKKGESFSAENVYTATASDFNLGGFLLGLILGPIGILIALLFGRNAVRWALYGFLVWIVLVLIGWLI